MLTQPQQCNPKTPLGRDDALRQMRNLLPLRHLSDSEFAIITSAVQLESCATGKDIFRSGQDDQFIFYLLAGKIAIADDEGESFDIVGGGVESRYPLTAHPRARVRATARLPAKYVRLSVDLMRLHREQGREGIIIDEIKNDDTSLDNRVLFDVYHALMENDLVLPSLPDMAIRIRQVANDENVAVEDIARIIQADASTAAYCISIANNVAFAATAKVNNVLDAVVRMGITPTRDLVVAYTIRSLFAGTDVQSKKLMREAWKHSCRIAALSYIIARDVGRLNPERALLAGLLHDIGVTVLINKVQAYPRLLNDVVEFNRLCNELSAQIGAMVLRSWKFTDVFVNAALEAEHFTKPASDRLDLADVVMLAHVHDRKPAPWSMQAANLAELAIRSKLQACDMTTDSRLAVIEDANRELTELTQLLNR